MIERDNLEALQTKLGNLCEENQLIPVFKTDNILSPLSFSLIHRATRNSHCLRMMSAPTRKARNCVSLSAMAKSSIALPAASN